MNNFQHTTKITEQHRSRKAIVYLRQSSPRQVVENQQSQRLQYAMADRARQLGFEHIETIDCDLGRSASLGAGPRAGFDSVLSAVAQGEVGIVLSRLDKVVIWYRPFLGSHLGIVYIISGLLWAIQLGM